MITNRQEKGLIKMKTKAEIIEQVDNAYLITRKHRGFKTYFPKSISMHRLKNVLAGHPRMMNGRIFYRV